MNTRIRIVLGILILLCCSADRLHSQATVDYALYETVSNGSLAIYEICRAYNPGDYISVEAGCYIENPDGTQVWVDNGGYQTEESWAQTTYSPVSVFGEWTGYATYELNMYEDCCDGNGNSYYIDEDGYSDVGDQICNASCIVYGSGEEQWLDYNPLYFAQSEPPSVDVQPVTVYISPSSVSLDVGESQTFTAEIAGMPSGYSTGVTWTISSLGGGTESSSASSYTYTAPATISSETTLTLKACSTAITSACDSVTIALLPESISIETPSPLVLPADGASVSYLYANLTGAPSDTQVVWTASPGTISSTGLTTATYQAPSASAAFPTGSTNPQLSVQIKGCIGVNAAVCPNQLPTLTLVEPVSINSNNGVTPSTLVAGTTTNVTIAGGGFGTSPTVTFTNPSWGTTGYSCPTVSNTSITCSVTVPANLSNMTGTTPITATVSATTDGLTTSATSSSISITPIAYTYTLSLTSSSPSPLTYGEVATITPHVACKTTSGTVCSGSVSNPQEAVFSYTGVGSLYPSGLATAATYAASTMLPSAQNSVVTIQGCLPASDGGGGCMTQTFNIAATTITLNPPAMSGPMTSAKTQGFSATIQNPGTANQLTWTLTPAGTAYGSLTSSTSAITGSTTSGTSGTTNAPADTYTPPTTITTAAAVTMSVCMTANTSICATPVVIQLPGFSITATNNNPSQTALSLGHSMSYAINVSALDGFNGTVALSVGGLPTGVTAKLSAPSITTSTSGSVTLTLTSAYSTSTYIGNSTISVTGSSGSMAVPASIPLTTRPLQYAGQCNVPTTISKFYPNPLYPY